MRKLQNPDIFKTKLNDILGDSSINQRMIHKNGVEIIILYIAVITDRKSLSTSIIKPILEYSGDERITLETLHHSIIYLDEIRLEKDFDKLQDYILKGNSVICIPNEQSYLVANTMSVERRTVNAPEIQTAIKGPRDSFTENMDTNLSLIRYRIKDPTLKIENFDVGSRSRTTVAMIYIEDIANQDLVKNIKKQLERIKLDGVFESGYIQKLINKNNIGIFPNVGISERSDSTCASLIQGKICLLVEGSNLALILPKVFIDFFDAGDDHYDNIYISIFNKVIRFLALIITLTFSSLYVSVVGFNPDILPPRYILALAASRITVPTNALLEAMIMEFVAEMLKEASIRLPKQIGPALGIVGTIVVGQAAVAAGLVSPLMVIIISLVTMSSFIAPDYTIIHPIRILKYLLLVVTGIFGLLGFTLGVTAIVIHIITTSSFGIPYFAPLTPFIFRDIKDFVLSDIRFSKLRPKILKDQDPTKQ